MARHALLVILLSGFGSWLPRSACTEASYDDYSESCRKAEEEEGQEHLWRNGEEGWSPPSSRPPTLDLRNNRRIAHRSDKLREGGRRQFCKCGKGCHLRERVVAGMKDLRTNLHRWLASFSCGRSSGKFWCRWLFLVWLLIWFGMIMIMIISFWYL